LTLKRSIFNFNGYSRRVAQKSWVNAVEAQMNEIEEMFYNSSMAWIESNRRIHGQGWDATIGAVNSWGDLALVFGERRLILINLFMSCYKTNSDGYFVLSPQTKIGKYRLDFSLDGAFDKIPYSGVGIEIDGHAFHERTKEQAAHDKLRDRFLWRNGYSVLRFTGSEIFKDPAMCFEEVITAFIDNQVWLYGIILDDREGR